MKYMEENFGVTPTDVLLTVGAILLIVGSRFIYP